MPTQPRVPPGARSPRPVDFTDSLRTRSTRWQNVADELLGLPTPVAALAARQGFVVGRAQARAAGISDAQVRRLVRSQRWWTPRRGVLCPVEDFPPALGDRLPEIEVSAAALVHPAARASHHSAATLHALPLLRRSPRPRLTLASRSHGGGWPGCVVHVAPLGPGEAGSWFGVPLTSVARTVVDLARLDGVAAGLVTADAALTDGRTTVAEIERSVRLAHHRPGVGAATRVAELARAGPESPLESLTRLCLIDGGLAPDELVPQLTVRTHRGTYRCDLGIRGHRVVIEADGRLKYQDSPDALWLEKLRQEALERAGFIVVRVTWDDIVRAPERTVARVRRAIAAADARLVNRAG